MIPPSLDSSKAQRWRIVVSLVLTASVIWPTAMDSTIAKLPLYFLCASLIFALLVSAILRDDRWGLTVGAIEILLIAHIVLFVVSSWWSFDRVYTWNALLFGVSSVSLCWAASRTYRTRKDVTRLIQGLLWLTAGLCAVGVIQYFRSDILPFTFLIGPGRRVPSLLTDDRGLALTIANQSYVFTIFSL